MLATASLTTDNCPLPTDNHRPRRPWKPDGDAHLIFQWVKMEGKSQGWVASALNVSQPTVSRIIQRYERWQAHAKEREDGRLDPAERLRAQRWLTFERNELILASCLRIAHEMEGFIDTSKSTILHEASRPSKELEVRTHHARIDRTGTVARFLRLAFRINMEQLKLAELDQPPPAAALSDEELAEEDRQAAADAAELAAARRRVGSAHHDVPEQELVREDDTAWAPSTTECGTREEEVGTAHPPDTCSHALRGNEVPDAPRPSPELPETLDAEPTREVDAPAVRWPAERGNEDVDIEWAPPTPGSVDTYEVGTAHPTVHNLHNLHNENAPEIDASAAEPCTCVSQPSAEKNSVTCITDCAQPLRPGDDCPAGAEPHIATAAAS
jgi:hypothetical protein